MPTLVIVGAQWGDEAKGKMVDVLGGDAKVVVRYSGGNNAGHTVTVGEEVFKFHLLPAAILHPGVVSVIGGGTAVCPKALLDELDNLKSRRPEIGRLVVSPSAHVVFPFHRQDDARQEEARGKDKIGTTSRGIGPTYTDKVRRTGIRMVDLVRPERLRQKLTGLAELRNGAYDSAGSTFDAEALYREYQALGQRLGPYVVDTDTIVQEAVLRGDKVMFEGAQGTMLDLDHGTYPYVTSSHPIAGGACLGTGIGPRDIHSVLAVAKAYTTRVGEGPFPTELLDETGEAIRRQGQEFGTTTGRPRRCGWLDLKVLRYSARVNSLSGWILTRLDVLSGIEKLKVATGYRLDGELLPGLPYCSEDWERVEPVYEEFEGWSEDLTSARQISDLPASAQRYLSAIEDLTDTPMAILSIGPERDQTVIVRPDLLWR
ncbi:MAG: adenylosuccinate synthase [Fimbriimonadaceae bacterium]|nr:adenylosuccinate synthase [Fimbriimonadaceae bacterium]QYK55681.1 MAG: adenylosuccinate synthase [Fimbriimonadaceae bacterium]